LDYGGFIQVDGKQRFETLDRHLHVVPSSDEDWVFVSLLHDYKHPSTWPHNLFPITGFAYMDKSFNSYGDYLHQLMAQAIPCSFYGDGPPLSLDDIVATLKVQVLTHGHLTQVNKAKYHQKSLYPF